MKADKQIFIDFSSKNFNFYNNDLFEKIVSRYLKVNHNIDLSNIIVGNDLAKVCLEVLNNDLSNLQILDRKVHCSVDVLRNKDITVKCTYCQKEFTIPGSKINNRNRRDRHNSGYFCSRSCSGKYGQEIQSGKRKPEEPHEKIIPEKYKAKSALGEIPDVEVG